MPFIFALFLVSGVSFQAQAQESLPACSVGMPAIDERGSTSTLPQLAFSRLPDESGDSHEVHLLEEWRGKVVVLNFWATWCPPCIQELPALLALQEHMPDSLHVVAVAADFSSLPTLRAFLDSRGLMSLWVHHDADLSLSGLLSIGRMPTTLIIDPEGRVALRHVGACDWHSPSVHRFIQALQQ